MVRRNIEGVLEAVWVSLGGCACHLIALRIWLAQCRHKAMGPAFSANPVELEKYFASSLKRLRNQSLGHHVRKRLFIAIWTSLSDADRKAFLVSDYACEVAA